MPVCSFCKRRVKEPRGLNVFTFDGRSIFYCSGKCRKNMEHLHRDPKKTKWVIKRKGYLEETGSDAIESVSEPISEKQTEKSEISDKKEKTKK